MGLFRKDYSRPGPGVGKDEPRKTGSARLREVLVRDFSELVKFNLFYQMCILPAQALLILAFLFLGSVWLFVFAALALAACIPLGPAKTALCFCIAKALRDDPGHAWHDFAKAFRSNFRLTAGPGVFYGLILGAQIFAAMYLFQHPETGFVIAMLFWLVVILTGTIAPYFFLQAGYLELSAQPLFKNSLVFFAGNLLRSLIGALFGSGIVVLLAVVTLISGFVTLPVVILLGYALPSLLCLFFIWPPVNAAYKIENTLRERDGLPPRTEQPQEKGSQ